METAMKTQVIDPIRDIIRTYGMENWIEVEGGGIRDRPGSGSDVVLISHRLYPFRSDLPFLFTMVASRLRPRGSVVSNHVFCRPARGSSASMVSGLDWSCRFTGLPLCRHGESALKIFRNGLTLTGQASFSSTFGFSPVHGADQVSDGWNQVPSPREEDRCPSCR